MTATALSLPLDDLASRPSFDLSLVRSAVAAPEGTVAERTTVGLPHDVLVALRTFSEQVLRAFVEPSIRASSTDEYRKILVEMWPTYMDAQRGINAQMLMATDRARALAWAERSQADAVAFIRNRIRDVAGARASGEVSFAAHTIERSLRLASSFTTLGQARDEQADRLAATRFEGSLALWSFEILSLLVVTAKRPQMSAGILDMMLEILRDSALGAHAQAERGLRLRKPEKAQRSLSVSRELDVELSALTRESEDAAETDLSRAGV